MYVSRPLGSSGAASQEPTGQRPRCDPPVGTFTQEKALFASPQTGGTGSLVTLLSLEATENLGRVGQACA